MRAPEDLRGGKLPRADQDVRDRLIAERYSAGETQRELEEAFLVSRGTVWAALKRMGAQLSPKDWAHRGLRA